MFGFRSKQRDGTAARSTPEAIDLKAAAADVLADAFQQIFSAFIPKGFQLTASERTRRDVVEDDLDEFDEFVAVEFAKGNGDVTYVVRLESTPGNGFADPGVFPPKTFLRYSRGDRLTEVSRFGQVSFSASGRVLSAQLQRWRRERYSQPEKHSACVASFPIVRPNQFNLAGRKKRDQRLIEAIRLMRASAPDFRCFLDPQGVIRDFLAGRWHHMDGRSSLEYALCLGTPALARQVFQRRYEELLRPVSEYDERSIEVRRVIGIPLPFDTLAPGRFVQVALALGVIQKSELTDLPTFADTWK